MTDTVCQKMETEKPTEEPTEGAAEKTLPPEIAAEGPPASSSEVECALSISYLAEGAHVGQGGGEAARGGG